jgi:hypothetical protein
LVESIVIYSWRRNNGVFDMCFYRDHYRISYRAGGNTSLFTL